jgi:putative sterol carrier protein
MNYSFGRTNEQLNFGAATVGGVTTGGFYKTGNDLYVSEEKKSGRYELAFVVGADQTSKVMIKNEYRSITEIIPVGDLALDAKASRISRFMDKKTNHIRVVDMGRTKVSSDELFKMAQDVSNVSGSKEYTQAGVSGVGSMDTQAKLNMAYPTKEKCEEILNWLAGE